MDELIVSLGKIFADAGGNPAPSGGPFPRFLSVVWEKLPEERRPKSKAAFVRRAQAELVKAKIQERVQG